MTTTVPNIVGTQHYQAQLAMFNAGLVYSTPVYAYDAVQPNSYVVSQNPAGGTVVPLYSNVTWNVSLGPTPVPPPLITVP